MAKKKAKTSTKRKRQKPAIRSPLLNVDPRTHCPRGRRLPTILLTPPTLPTI